MGNESVVAPLIIGETTYYYFSLPKWEAQFSQPCLTSLPYSLKILLENILRHEDQQLVKREDSLVFAEWAGKLAHEIAYYPARILMQDFTGVPAMVDLSAMRDALQQLGGTSQAISPVIPVDLVIDHSVQVDYFASDQAFAAQCCFRIAT